MSIEYKVFRGPRGEDLSEIAQVADTKYRDNPPDPGEYDYQIQAVDTNNGEEGQKTARRTQKMYWAPDFVSGNVQLHLDAGRTDVFNSVSITDDRVDTWYDMAGSDHLTQGTASSRPDYDQVVLGGDPVISFESGEELNTSSFSVSPPYTFAILFRQTATGTRSIVSDGLTIGKSSGSWTVGGNTGGSTNTGWNIITFHVQSNISHVRVNGSEIASGTGGISIGSIAIGGAELDVAEVVLTNGILPQIIEDGTRDPERLEGYLAGRWGVQGKLPASHPYSDQQPSWYVDPTQLIVYGTGYTNGNGKYVEFVKEGTNHFRMLNLGSKYVTLELDPEISHSTSDATSFGTTISDGVLTFTSPYDS